MSTLLQDLKFGLRMLAKNPGFTAVAVLTLALGIGANTAIFSIVNAILLRPLPGIPRIDGLVQLGRATFANGVWVDFDTVSYPNYEDYRDRNHVFDGLTAFAHIPMDLGGDEGAERIKGAVATANYFQVLGVDRALGRMFISGLRADAETQPIAVLSYHLWQRRFGGDRSLIGKEIRLNSHPFVVVGVASQGFRGTQLDDPADLWVPMTFADEVAPAFVRGWNNKRGANWLQVVGRLKPGVSPRQAQAEMQSIAHQLELAYPGDNKDVGVAVDSHLGMWPGDRVEARGFAALLMVIVGQVLLIACANVAGLLFAKACGRRKEIAVRMALGAGRSRVVCQLLIESGLLALAAGFVAFLMGFWTSDLLSASWLSTILPRADFTPDIRVFAFTLLVALITSLVFGLLPALQSSQANLIGDLKESAGAPVRERLHLRNGLVVGQIALCLVLLVAAGLTVRTLQALEGTNPGVEVRNILAVDLDVGNEGYDETRGRLFYQQLLERVQSLPGVTSACLTLTAPVNLRQWGTRVSIDDPFNPLEASQIPVHYTSVTPDYFSTLGISLVAGRGFSDRDGSGSRDVVIVNQTMARRLWPGENPIGRRLHLEQGSKDLEIVGVANDVTIRDLGEAPRPYMYLPFTQRYESRVVLLVRARTNPLALLPSVEREVHSLDRDVPLISSRTLTEHVEQSLGQQRLTASLITIFGVLALALATVGLYGTISYAVSQRTHEIGIRMALGAQKHDIARLVVGQGFKLTLTGVAIGVIGALALTRFLSTLLYGVKPSDPMTFVTVSLLLTAVALLACYIPARRATKVDPMVALRYE